MSVEVCKLEIAGCRVKGGSRLNERLSETRCSRLVSLFRCYSDETRRRKLWGMWLR